MTHRPQIPVFVVSLARAAERRQAMCAHLDELGLTFRLIDAVDGRALDPAFTRAKVAPGVTIHAGAVGRYLSHIQIYQAMVDEGIEAALVLEDDARLSPRAVPMLTGAFDSAGFDYCFLDSEDHNESGPVFYDRDDAVALAPGFHAHRLSAGPQTTHAYIIGLPAARRRLEHAFPIRQPIDLYDVLPYPIVFRAVVTPKTAWVSSDSLSSFTSDRQLAVGTLKLKLLRRSILFYRVKDFVQMKWWQRRRLAKAWAREGRLDASKTWLPLPSGRQVVL